MSATPPPPAVASTLAERDALPPGTRFGELEIVRVLGMGGFGIVYLAQDHALERPVALKEYMPSSLAGRGQGQLVSIRSGAHTETYALGLRSFVNEARLLARFNHPSLVKVYRFWEQNGTAYMVMPYLQGRTLREVRRSMSAAPTEAWMRSVIGPLLDALEQLHREDVFHRDIAPDNILLPPGELPVLLDFGAARRAIGDHTQTFTAILKPSYAPIEQYAEVVQLRQGAWTDLYALGAVVYYLLAGTPPPPATARAVQDDGPLLDPARYPDVSPPFVAAVEWALAVRPGDRPQSVAALRDVLEGRAVVPLRARTGTTAPLVTPPVTGADATAHATAHAPAYVPAYAPTVALPKKDADETLVPTQPLARQAAAGARIGSSLVSRLGLLVAALVAFVAIAAATAWLSGGRAAKASPAAGASPARPVATAPAVIADPVAAAPPAVTAPDPVPAAATTQPPVVSALRPVARAAQQRPATATTAMEDSARGLSGIAPQATTPTHVLPPPAAAAARQQPATPREACGSRVFMALALCMEEQCQRSQFHGHPQCKRVLDRLERRRRGEGGD